MIVFTITNRITEQVYVGTTKGSADDRWSQLVLASALPLDFPLYEEIRTHGALNFDVWEWAEAETLDELKGLEDEAIQSFNARSLRGYRTSLPTQAPRVRAPLDLEDFND